MKAATENIGSGRSVLKGTLRRVSHRKTAAHFLEMR